MHRKISYRPDQDYYAVLGVPSSATEDEIRRAYRQLVRKIHPDLNPNRRTWATRKLQYINEAYSVLSDPLERIVYDQMRRHYRMLQRKRSGSGVRRGPRPGQRPPPGSTRYAYRPPPGSHYNPFTYTTYATPGPQPYMRYQAWYSGKRSPASTGSSTTKRYYTHAHTHAMPRPTFAEMDRARRADVMRLRLQILVAIALIIAACVACYGSFYWPLF